MGEQGKGLKVSVRRAPTPATIVLREGELMD
jgi:hypothetical protein